MNTKIVPIVIGIIVVVIAGGLIFMNMKPSQSSPVTPSTPSTPSTSTDQGSQKASSDQYTATEVATHSSASSCWTIIDGNIYDLTQWIPQHPGGQRAIIGLCGHDGSAAFHGQHDDAKQQADILATFKIGTLTQ